MKLAVGFRAEKKITLKLKESNQSFKPNCGEVHKVVEYIGGELYEGDYVVTPKVEGQVIPTKDKVMVENMEIRPIPFFNVSNTSGGNTVYIGNEV